MRTVGAPVGPRVAVRFTVALLAFGTAAVVVVRLWFISLALFAGFFAQYFTV